MMKRGHDHLEMEDSRGTLCRNRRVFGMVEHLRCGRAGSVEGGEDLERADNSRLLLSGSEGGTVARAGGNTCAPLSARLDLKAPRSRGRIRTTPDHLSH